jgi:putative two-component system response regulator
MMHVLVAEDEPITAEYLRESLCEFGYEVSVARNGREALEHIRTGRFRLVVSDWSMPEISGVELCRRIRSRHFSSYVYIILLTSRTGTESIVEGLNAGADDFVTKPFEPQELALRLHAGERLLALESRDVTIFALAKLAESRDPETGTHLERIREYCRILATHLGREPRYRERIDGDYAQLIYLTSTLHDIGKVGIPDAVLLKPGPLTEDEFNVMKRHTIIGGRTLDAALRARPEAEFLAMGRDIAWTHHEWVDGSGYPMGLKGEQIPLSGRIVALADVYDALTTRRVYKPAFSHDDARSMILERAGMQFDPDLVEAFLANEESFLEIHKSFSQTDSHDVFRLPLPEYATTL